MNKKIRRFKLPGSSFNCVSDATIQVLGAVIILRFDYFKIKSDAYRSAILFEDAITYRYRSQNCCTIWHIEDANDCVVEVTESEWLVQQISEMHVRHRDSVSAKHFLIWLDSFGCFEALADSFHVLDEQPGSWKEYYDAGLNAVRKEIRT